MPRSTRACNTPVSGMLVVDPPTLYMGIATVRIVQYPTYQVPEWYVCSLTASNERDDLKLITAQQFPDFCISGVTCSAPKFMSLFVCAGVTVL